MLRLAECPCFSSHWQPWWLQKQHRNQCCKFTYRNSGGSLNSSFSVATGISPSEQWWDRRGDGITRFLSRGWNSSTVSEVKGSWHSLTAKAQLRTCPSSKPDTQGRAHVCSRRCLGCAQLQTASQLFINHHPPYTQGLGQFNEQKQEVLLFILKK